MVSSCRKGNILCLGWLSDTIKEPDPKRTVARVDWLTLLVYGLPGLVLTEIALLWLWVRFPPVLSDLALALGEQEPVATAAGGFLLGIAVARAARLEAQAPPSPA